MITLTDQKAKEDLELFAECAVSDKRHFLYCTDIVESYETKYNYWEPSFKLKQINCGEVGTISDAHILFAAACMGTCTVETLRDVLSAYSQNHKELLIARMDISTNMMADRLNVLLRSGFIFRANYVNRTGHGEVMTKIYIVDKDSQSFMNAKLKKNMPLRAWPCTASPLEMVSIAAAAYVCGKVSLLCGGKLAEMMLTPIRTREMGTVNLPPTMIFDYKEYQFKVLFMPAFIRQEKDIQTEKDFEKWCLRKINLLKNYFYLETEHGNIDRIPLAVIVCEDMKDLERFIYLVIQTEVLEQYENMPRIYLTTEGAFRHALPRKFLQVNFEHTERGLFPVYTFSDPVFLQGDERC